MDHSTFHYSYLEEKLDVAQATMKYQVQFWETNGEFG